MIIDKPFGLAEVLFVKKNDFLGTSKSVDRLYDTKPKWYLFAGFIIITLVFLFIYFKRRKSISQLIISKSNEIQEDLKNEDYKILYKLAESYPDYINYSELLDMFPEYLGYESKKKKIRQSIITIEEYLNQKFKISTPVFTYRKNIEDRREKQIRIKQ